MNLDITEEDLKAQLESFAKQEDGMTCQEAFDLCEPWLAVHIDNDEYRNIHEDYRLSTLIYNEAEANVAETRKVWEELEKEMNASVPGGITDKMFADYYESVYRWKEAEGRYLAILNRRAASAVVFLDTVKRIGGELKN